MTCVDKKNTFTFIFVLLMLTACKVAAEKDTNNIQSLESNFEKTTLTIIAEDNKEHELFVYLASEPYQQRRGLMFIRDLPENTGMLFTYQRNNIHSMWMKNTYIPLDIIFVREDGSVSSIIHNTKPMSLRPLNSIEPIKYVLELNGGSAKNLNLGENSRFKWKEN
tara:strand:- start:204 stop:698 length:495 start_codon:yes stop_codon:yes gene_type:complete